MPHTTGPEQIRLREDAAREKNWKRWGPYLSERQWGTVREDYSADGDAWAYFPHDHARSRAYRWGEDGLMGITDRECRLCFAWALWNGRDPILKERLFGLTNPEGNHGEDVKECYWYLESTPTHSYFKGRYRYPHAAFPYDKLVKENGRRGLDDPEYELEETGIFEGGAFFDLDFEYAKAGPDDLLIQVTVHNHGTQPETIHLLPNLWFRNTWSWGCKYDGATLPPSIRLQEDGSLIAEHETLGRIFLYAEEVSDSGWWFTENDTNTRRLSGTESRTPHTKDAFHRRLIGGEQDATSPEGCGTKAALHWQREVPAGGVATFRLRLCSDAKAKPFADFTETREKRRLESLEFMNAVLPSRLSGDRREVAKQAYAGLLWTKQYYGYVVESWLDGDPGLSAPASGRTRNQQWPHLFSSDVLSVPDKWEYPWFAAWDLAFHMIPMAHVDPAFAQHQLELLLREWYLHPNGQMPAYEWNFSDVNPPVHAWACWRVYKIGAPRGHRDRLFLERVFQKLLMNFTWWVNRKDPRGNNLFSGGFLGLDNIGMFDRSKPLPSGRELEQADGTAWMAFYCSTMLAMALELAQENPAYEDIASKFFEHFVQIVQAMNALGGGLWSEDDGFYYDQIRTDGTAMHLRVRSMVGIVPLLAAEVIEQATVEALPGFRKRARWFLKHRPELASHTSYMERDCEESCALRLLAVPSRERLIRALTRVFDEAEFLSPHGVRSLSRSHAEAPFRMVLDGEEHVVGYEPGESRSHMFGGNSNWRGPIWFPLNYLLIEALERYHHFYGDTLQMEFPTGSGNLMNLRQISQEISSRLVDLFIPGEEGKRPCYTGHPHADVDPKWKGLWEFHEYFDGDTGRGLGAKHQSGWTALVARLLRK